MTLSSWNTTLEDSSPTQPRHITKRQIMSDYLASMDTVIAKSRNPLTYRPIPTTRYLTTQHYMPPLDAVITDLSTAAHVSMLATEIAIRSYRERNETYPAALQDLVPRYLPATPGDPYSSRSPLRYRVSADRYVLYSVGPDMKDDGGRVSVSPTSAVTPIATPANDGALIVALGGVSRYGPTNLGDIVAGAPQVPSVAQISAGNGSAMLIWNAASARAASYNVYRGTSPGRAFLADPVASGLHVTRFTDTGLQNGKPYYYCVGAVSESGVPAVSAEITVSPVAPPSDPPTELVAQAVARSVRLSWIPVADQAATGSHYVISRSTDPSARTASRELRLTSDKTFIDTEVVGGQRYYYRVAAENAGGRSPSSPVASALVVGSLPKPAGLAARIVNHQVVVTWNAVPGATGYSAYSSLSPGGELSIPPNELSIRPQFITQTFAPSPTRQYFRIAARNTRGVSPLSDEISIMVPAMPASRR